APATPRPPHQREPSPGDDATVPDKESRVLWGDPACIGCVKPAGNAKCTCRPTFDTRAPTECEDGGSHGTFLHLADDGYLVPEERTKGFEPEVWELGDVLLFQKPSVEAACPVDEARELFKSDAEGRG
ncbi:hypothetical protein FRB90_008925, partial [Tulasnella sp. 427]